MVCPNHSWAYGLDGKIRGRPHFFGGEQHDIHKPGKGPQGLKAVRSAVWHDLVFINLDGKADPFDQYIKPMADRLEDYDLSILQHAGALEWELNCNWKLVHENFIEPFKAFLKKKSTTVKIRAKTETHIINTLDPKHPYE